MFGGGFFSFLLGGVFVIVLELSLVGGFIDNVRMSVESLARNLIGLF